MKRLTLFVLLFTVNFIVRGQQLPNGDFENWVSQPYGEEPIDWGEYNTQVYNLIFPGLIDSTIVKSTDAYSGSYALEMRSKTYSYFGSVDTVAPFVMLNLKNANIDSAFLEINSNLLSISGYIKQNLVNVDSNYTGITVMVFSNGNQEGVGSLIFDSSITNYTFFDVPIVYSGVPNGDSIEIYLFGGNSNFAIPGNIVKLDGLQLNYITNTPIIYGCTDSSSLNFDPLATVDDGSCVPIIFGCTTLNDTVCDSYTWNGNTFNTSGTYNNPSGSCVDTLNLVVNYSSSSYMSTIACNKYVWNGNAITVTGLYFNTSTNSDGCPQYDSLDLTVDNSTFGTDLINACDSYTWIDGITYTSTNNSAQDTLVNTDGCDSIVTLDLTINYSSSSYSTLSSCNSYDWNGQTYTSNGLYINFSTNQSGCPQTDTLDLTITTSGTAVNDTVCDSYNWKGNTINNSGTYFNSNGSCLEILNLVVDYTSNSYLNIVACDEFITNGNTYTSSGIYYDTLQTLHGCDSSVTLDLTVNYTSSSLNTVISCNDYLWNGDLYTNSGFYIDTLQSISGCDSLATLSIIIKEVTVDTITVNSCDFYFWRGNTYNQSGIYRDTLQSVLGCDSILLLDLILDNPTFTNDSVTSCQHYLWNGNNYTLSGIYTDSLFSLNGCDSIVTLSLTIINSFQGDTLEISTCDEFLWQGNQYTQTGLFSDTLISNIGCDSIIYLNLTINNSFEIDEYVNACISYNWNGKTYNVSGLYTDTLEASFGCDSIINLNLNISNNQFFSTCSLL